MKTPLQKYATSGHRSVEGWLSDTAVALVLELARIQAAMGVSGPVCEIGVHHGRLFLLLHLLHPDDRAVVWDLFEQQHENVDQSGAGDLAALNRNLERHHADTTRIRIIQANSLRLRPEDVLRECGAAPSVFSIDGGHTAEITRSDLALAARVLARAGLIVLDDAFNEGWPGVAEGMCRYFGAPEPEVPLYPVIIGGNKLVFTNDSDAARRYQAEFALPHGLFGVKRSVVFGHEVAIVTAYRRTLARRVLHSRPVLALHDSAAGRFARRLLKGS